jgi:hypothetical protein
MLPYSGRIGIGMFRTRPGRHNSQPFEDIGLDNRTSACSGHSETRGTHLFAKILKFGTRINFVRDGQVAWIEPVALLGDARVCRPLLLLET